MPKVKKLTEAQLVAVSRLFQVLAEPSRLAILQELMSGPKTVNEIVSHTGSKQANISKQLGVLYDTELVARERDGNSVIYSLRDSFVSTLCELVCDRLQQGAKKKAKELSGQ